MLKVTSLSYAFSQRQLFADVSFTLQPGDILHLQGANGVGKSTLLSVIAGLRSQASGSITCHPATEAPPLSDRRQFFSYLPAEANGLYLKMDAKDNLMFWSELRGHALSPEAAHDLLARWGLGHRLLRQDFPVGRFSTGMRRRLALARVSLSGAPCWLLDEPIYGLDEKGVGLLQDLLAHHQATGGMAIIVSHADAALGKVINRTFELTPVGT